MFSLHDKNSGNKVFWFVETKGGNQKLVRPDGSYVLMRERNRFFKELGRQGLAGWQRAKLLMDEYGIWDATSFASTMSSILGIRTFQYEDGEPVVYLFSSCQNAEENVYPYLSEEISEQCRKNVDDFYANPNLQAAWNDFILHPVCLKVSKDKKTFTPTAISSIGCGQKALGEYKMLALCSIEDEMSLDLLYED